MSIAVTPDDQHLLTERRGRTLVVTMNRPEARNALSGPMMRGMEAAWDLVDSDPEIRACILTGAGGYFCAGVLFGPMAHWYTAPFPPRLRYSGVSLSYQVGAVLGGGLSPAIAVGLLKGFGGSTVPISLYLVLGAAVAAGGLVLVRGRIRAAVEAEHSGAPAPHPGA